MADKRLLDYIRISLEKGLSEKQIKQKLEAAGWTKPAIEQGFKSTPRVLKTALKKTNSEITSYITTNRKKGYSDTEIKKALAKAGWKSTDINNAFNNIKSQTSDIKKIQDYIKKYQAQGYSKDQIVDALKKSGKTQEEIDEAYKRLDAKGEKNKIDKKWILAGIAILLLLLLIGGLLLFLPSDTGCTDNDNDGYLGGLTCATDDWDCNDNDINIHPGTVEVCGDNVDNDCDNRIDEGCQDITPGVVTVGQLGDACEEDIDCTAGLTCINGICSEYQPSTGISSGILEPECNDGADNDNDNHIDYSGGCDEDGDGILDSVLPKTDCENINGTYYIKDKGCSDADDGNELATCQNLVDDDNDGYIDYTGGCDDDSDGDLDYYCGCDIDEDEEIDFPDESMTYQDCIDAGYDADLYFCENEPDSCNETGYTFVYPDADCNDLDSNAEQTITTEIFECDDGIDNDGDGLIDMNDPGCTALDDNLEFNVGGADCDDGIDNDGDGLIDMNDPGCNSIYDLSEVDTQQQTLPDELPDLQIFSINHLGLDNMETTQFEIYYRNGGLAQGVDYAEITTPFRIKGEFLYGGTQIPTICDAGITQMGILEEKIFVCEINLGNAMDVLETNLIGSNCAQGLDIEFKAEVDPLNSVVEHSETNNEGSLSDTWDLTDFIAAGGTDLCPSLTTQEDGPEYATPQNQLSGPQCSDGYDNDGDGLIDGQDPGCVGTVYNALDDDERNQCSDGYDNDGDGLVDLNDPACQTPQIDTAKEKDDNIGQPVGGESFFDNTLDVLNQFLLGRKPMDPEINEQLLDASAAMGMDLIKEYNIPQRTPIQFAPGLQELFEEEVTKDIIVDRLNNNEYDFNNGDDVLQFYEDVSRVNYDLSDSNLQGANLNRAVLSGVNLQGTNLQGANLNDAVIFNSNLDRTNLQSAQINRVTFNKVELKGANLDYAVADRVVLSDTNVQNSNLKLQTKDVRVKGTTNLDQADTTIQNTQVTVIRDEITTPEAINEPVENIRDTNVQVSTTLVLTR